jgi:NADPH2:quinone reductase
VTATDGDHAEHAIEIDRYGGPEELAWRAVRRPPLKPDEVRIRTLYAAVNRADIEIRRGEWQILNPEPFPYTPGLEVVGVVDSVGDQVTDVEPGAVVITMMQHLGGIWGERPGGYGEFVVVPGAHVAVLPPGVDAEQMAALGLVAVTAAEGLTRLDLKAGARVVIHGASGGVGSAAVALGSASGAEVIAVLPRAGKEAYVRGLGAAQVVRLDERRLLEALGARSVDAVLETTGARTFADSTAVLRRGGRLCLVGALAGADLTLSAWDLIQDLVLTGWSSENLTADRLRGNIAQIADLVRGGRLPAPAINRFALADAEAAHRAIEGGQLKGRALLCA